VQVIPVVAVGVVLLVRLQIAMEIAAHKLGSQTDIAMTAPMNGMVSRSILIVMRSSATAVTAHVMVAAGSVLLAKLQIAMEIAVLKHGLVMGIVMTVHTIGTAFQFT
jgi:hypothetical protein